MAYRFGAHAFTQAVKQLIADGVVTDETSIWSEGMADWTTLQAGQSCRQTAFRRWSAHAAFPVLWQGNIPSSESMPALYQLVAIVQFVCLFVYLLVGLFVGLFVWLAAGWRFGLGGNADATLIYEVCCLSLFSERK